jgi:hypothetical protein
MLRTTRLFRSVVLRACILARVLLASASLSLSTATAMAREHHADRIVFVLHEQSPAAGVLHPFERIQLQLGELDVDIAAVHLARPEAFAEQALQAKRVAERQGAIAVFWFTTRAQTSVSVYALHAASGRVFARDVSLGDNETVQREQLAIVLRAAVPAVLRGAPDVEPLLVVPPDATIGSDPPRDARSAPEVAIDPRSDAGSIPEASPSVGMIMSQPKPLRLRAAAGYFGSKIAATAGWQSGISGELMLDAGEWLRAGLGAGYATPITLHGADADALIARVPLVARVGLGCSFGRTTVGLEGGGLAEAWRRQTVVRSSALAPTEPSTVWRFGATLSGRLELSLFGDLGLYLLGEAQWLPARHELEVRSADTEQQLPAHSLRAHLGLGATLRLPWITSAHANDGRQAE